MRRVLDYSNGEVKQCFHFLYYLSSKKITYKKRVQTSDVKFQVHGSVHRYDKLNKNANQMYFVLKILKILFTLFRSICFGQHCVHHQESFSCTCSLWSRVLLGSLCPPVLLCCNCSRGFLKQSTSGWRFYSSYRC